jgi:hypothetical protein
VAETLATRPDTVHLADHAMHDGKPLFEEDGGAPALMKADAVASVLRMLMGSLSYFVLSSYLSAARSVADSTTVLPDQAVFEFTRGCYSALAIGVPGSSRRMTLGSRRLRPMISKPSTCDSSSSWGKYE